MTCSPPSIDGYPALQPAQDPYQLYTLSSKTPSPRKPGLTPEEAFLLRQRLPLTRNNRRLQIRNERFKATNFPELRLSPSRRWSAPVDSWTTNHVRLSHVEDNGDNLKESEEPKGKEQHPLGILREISNSTRRRRQAARGRLDAIFPDVVRGYGLSREGSPHLEPVSDENALREPEILAINNENARENTMKAQDIYFNPQTPPSTMASHTGTPKEHRSRRSTSIDSPKYIEHLESQLRALQSQRQGSPSKSQSAKIRALTAETNNLKHELSRWEDSFHSRVAELEREKEGTIQMLQFELEVKDEQLVQLEREQDMTLTRIKSLESLEQANYDLEKRLEFMSELLAHSPAKVDLHFESRKGDGTRKKRRPISMMPRIPSVSNVPSPTPIITSVKDVNFSAEPISAPASALDSTDFHYEASFFDASNQYQSSSDSSMLSAPSSGFSSNSLQSLQTQATSLTSEPSYSPRPWNSLPLPSPLEESQKPGHLRRRMRRFHSGSATRPLILPNASHVDSCPATAPLPNWNPPQWNHTVSPRMGDATVGPRTTMTDMETAPTGLGLSSLGEQQEHISKINKIPEQRLKRQLVLPPSYQLVLDIFTKSFAGMTGLLLLDELARARLKADLDTSSSDSPPPSRRTSTQHHVFSSSRSSAIYRYSSAAARLSGPPLLSQMWKNPTFFARKVISNAWYFSMRLRPFVSWLVFGLLLRPFCTTPYQPGSENGSRKHMPSLSEDQRRNERWNRTYTSRLIVWAKFSAAIIVAVGVALKDGPANLFTEDDKLAAAAATHAHCGDVCQCERSASAQADANLMNEMD
ncbi:MAG: hypothetical protein M1819_004044 [Sarea resinae]|nr:MAG: hypothetical protein M1819_004044 [Sarea resinae]